MVMGYSPAESLAIAKRLNCRLGSFPSSYLGTPISDSRLSAADLRPAISKLQSRCEPWQGRWLSKAARTILINSSLSSLLLFLMSFYSLHESLHKEIAKIQSRFYWAGEHDKQKYHMVSWPDICKPREQGGLGIMCSKRMNIALLSRREIGAALRVLKNSAHWLLASLGRVTHVRDGRDETDQLKHGCTYRRASDEGNGGNASVRRTMNGGRRTWRLAWRAGGFTPR